MELYFAQQLATTSIVPVFHNLKQHAVSHLNPLFDSCALMSFSFRDPEAVRAIPLALSLNNKKQPHASIGVSSIVSEQQVLNMKEILQYAS